MQKLKFKAKNYGFCAKTAFLDRPEFKLVEEFLFSEIQSLRHNTSNFSARFNVRHPTFAEADDSSTRISTSRKSESVSSRATLQSRSEDAIHYNQRKPPTKTLAFVHSVDSFAIGRQSEGENPLA